MCWLLWLYDEAAEWLSALGLLRKLADIVQLSNIQPIWRGWRMDASRSVTL